ARREKLAAYQVLSAYINHSIRRPREIHLVQTLRHQPRIGQDIDPTAAHFVVSTWNWPYHLCTPCIWMTGSLACSGRHADLAVARAAVEQKAVRGIEAPLQVQKARTIMVHDGAARLRFFVRRTSG
ncbi:hypothetical protein U8L64_00280, partial [Pseudomonas sp. FIP_A4]